MSKPEAHILLEKHLDELRIKWEAEYKFHPTRKWRADYKVSASVLVDIQGSIWTQGRHTRGAGYQADVDKSNEAQALGYRFYRFTTEQVLKGQAKEFLAKNL